MRDVGSPQVITSEELRDAEKLPATPLPHPGNSSDDTRLVRSGDSGVLERWFVLLNQHDEVVQEGRLNLMVSTSPTALRALRADDAGDAVSPRP